MINLAQNPSGRRTSEGARMPIYPYSIGCVVMLGAALSTAHALGEANASYEVPWSTLDGGGLMFSFGELYQVSGTIGQPEPAVISGGDYTVASGFWVFCPRSPSPQPEMIPDSSGELLVSTKNRFLSVQRASLLESRHYGSR